MSSSNLKICPLVRIQHLFFPNNISVTNKENRKPLDWSKEVKRLNKPEVDKQVSFI